MVCIEMHRESYSMSQTLTAYLFLNADPIGFSGGLNWFAYADGNPISKSDPLGLVAWGLPAQLHQAPAFTQGYWQGAGAAIPAGVGLATLPFTGPVVGGALLSAGINTTSQLAEQHVNPEARFSGVSFAVDTGIGAVAPYGLNKGIPYVAKALPTSVKGHVGEGLTYINGVIKGRGFTPNSQRVMPVTGRPPQSWPRPDFTYPGQGAAGGHFTLKPNLALRL